MNRGAKGPFAAYVGIDWADKKHDVCVQAAGSEERELGRFAHRVAAIEAWARSMHERFGEPIAVALELSEGPIVYALQKYDYLVLFPINPTTLAQYRKAFKPSGSKDDPTDAELALDLLVRHPERFKPLKPQSVEMRKLMHLVEQRRRVVEDKRRFTNRLCHALKQYYPQALEWFEQRDTVVFCDFLDRWPTLKQVKRARRATLERFFKDHNVRFARVIERRLEGIEAADPLTEDTAVIEAYRMQVQVLVAQIRATLAGIAEYEKVIEATAAALPDYSLLFSPLPGAGSTNGPRLLAAMGEDRDRFDDAAQLQRCSGLAPVTERSGDKTWVHWRWKCPKFLRQTFVEWAGQTINKSAWAGAYYRQQRARGVSHQAAVRALAFKWTRILYRCWKDRVPYDESKYLEALRRRGSPLLQYLVDPA
jgi:transposase